MTQLQKRDNLLKMKGVGQLNTFSESSVFIFEEFTLLTALLI